MGPRFKIGDRGRLVSNPGFVGVIFDEARETQDGVADDLFGFATPRDRRCWRVRDGVLTTRPFRAVPAQWK